MGFPNLAIQKFSSEQEVFTRSHDVSCFVVLFLLCLISVPCDELDVSNFNQHISRPRAPPAGDNINSLSVLDSNGEDCGGFSARAQPNV